MLLLQNGRVDVGIAVNVDRRFQEHLKGNGGKTTLDNPPSKFIFTEEHPNRDSAARRERQLKHWTRAKKLALAEGRTCDLKTLSKRRNL